MEQAMKMLLKKAIIITLAIVACVIVMPLNANAAVKINKTSVTICRYHQYQLKISGAKEKIKWMSSNQAVASVDRHGTVTAKEAGSAKIKAVIGKKAIATCKVTVKSYLRQEELAAYAYNAVQQELFGNQKVKIDDVKYSIYMDGREFSYFQIQYTDYTGKKRTAYVSVYENTNESMLELNANTALYGNLVVEVSGSKMEKMMEKMMEDRSSSLKASKVVKIAGLLKKTEKIGVQKGSMFQQKHTWMDLSE